MTLSALDDVLRGAASVRVSEIGRHGWTLVDLSNPGDRERLRAAMTVASLPGAVCACCGQVRFEFLDEQGDSLPMACCTTSRARLARVGRLRSTS